MVKNVLSDKEFYINASACVFKLGLRSFMNSISNTRQSNLLWHFWSMQNWLSLRRLVSPRASKKCLPIAEFLCSTIC